MSTENIQPTQLTLTDLQNAVVIIDAAAERGAFKGPELASVGAVRDKIAAVVAENTPKEQQEVSEDASPKSEATEEAPAKAETKKKPRKAAKKKTS